MLKNSGSKQKAIKLRRSGYLYSQIASELGVAKSTAYAWTSGLELLPAEAATIQATLRAARLEKIRQLAFTNKLRKQERDRLICSEAKAVVSGLVLDQGHKKLLCALLFWCEGGKNTAAGIHFINSDPLMVQTFLSLFRESFVLDEKKFRILLHLHEYHDPAKQLVFWSKLTGVPVEQFHKPYLKPHTGNKLPTTLRSGY